LIVSFALTLLLSKNEFIIGVFLEWFQMRKGDGFCWDKGRGRVKAKDLI